MELLIIALLAGNAAGVGYLVQQTRNKTTNKKMARVFVDTSVLIDGRIVAVAQSGFITDTLSIPRSVIGELQFLADNADSDKRTRARHGLDVVTELQAMPTIAIEIFPDGSKAEEGVDERLLKLAKQYDGAICTIDYNLNKVAQVEQIKVLNVNDLALSLRMAYLPGERMILPLTSKGNDSHQAVGHLPDGTMVVVERAKSKIGSSVEIEFIRSLQTSAGKMMFAKLVDPDDTARTADKKAPVAKGRVPRNQAKQQPNSRQSDYSHNKPTEQPAKVEAPGQYHSDPREQAIVQKKQRRQQPSARRSVGAQNKQDSTATAGKQSQSPRPGKQQKPKTSRERESSLIELVNSQSE